MNNLRLESPAGPAAGPLRALIGRPVLALAFLGSIAGPAQAAIFTPTTFSDLAISSLAVVNSLGQITNQANAITLRSAVIAANAAGGTNTINLNAGTYQLTIPGTGETSSPENPLIGDLDALAPTVLGNTNTLTIQGAGSASTIIQQTTADRVFELHAGLAATYPGSITFVLDDATVKGGNSSASGGGILAGRPGDITTLTDCVFDGNTAATNGGAISASSSLASHNLTITNCVFSNNTATGAVGGAVNYNGIGTVAITRSVFTNNVAGTQGGAVNVSGGGAGGVYNVSTSTFLANTANGSPFGGGAIAVFNGQSLNVHFNRFQGNLAPNVGTGKIVTDSGGTVTTFDVNTNWWGTNSGPGGGVQGTAPTTWLQLRNSGSPSTINVGGTSNVSADIFGLNTGGSTAPGNLTGLAAFPTAGTVFGNAQNGTIAPGTIQFVGGAASVVFTGTVPGVGGVDAVADAQTVTAPITVSASANLAITKTDGVTTATPGGSTTYTITASNAGPSNTTGTVADTFPASLTCTWTCVGAGGGTCTASGSGNINNAVTLPTGGSVTYTATCSISASATGSLANTATVTGAATDPTPGNNSATDTDTLVASANLGITKNDGVSTATPGGSTTYTISASNAGPSNTTATVADTFPATLTCTWTCVGSSGGTCTASGSGNINDPVTLPSGGSVTYTAACAISASATGTLANTATVSGAATDPTPGNNSATDTDTLVGVADIAIAKTVNNASPGLGSNVVFTVTATNNGPSNATGVQVSDLLPTGLAFVSATPSQGSYTSGTGLWTVGSLANGASATLAVTATVNRTQAIVNQASKSAAGEVDPKGSNNTATVGLNSAALIDIQVTQTADNLTPTATQNVTFLITAKNGGTASATSVSLTSNLPSGLAFVASTPSQGSYASGTGVWSVGTLAPGASATLSLVMTYTVARGTTQVTHTFTKTFATEQDLVTGNDAASVALNAQTVLADLALTKIASQDPVANGLNFNYVIVATNLGPGDATGVTVTDTLPAGVSFVSSAASQGSCSGTATVTCALGTLAPGASATIDLVVTKTTGGSVTNTASVTGNQNDPNSANNSNAPATTPVELMSFAVD